MAPNHEEEIKKRDDQVLKDAIRDFKRSVEITRDVRFQANLRLAGRQRASAYIVSFLSLYVIALSLLPNILALKPFQSQILLACSIVFSVFIIFTSLIDGAQNFYHQGELLHQCARKIATVHHNLKNIDVDANAEKARTDFDSLQREYAKALDDCPINHANVDFYHEKVRKPHLFVNEIKWPGASMFKLWFWLKATAFGNFWVVPHVLVSVEISAILYFWVTEGVTLIGR